MDWLKRARLIIATLDGLEGAARWKGKKFLSIILDEGEAVKNVN